MSWAEVITINSNMKYPLNRGILRDAEGNDYAPVFENQGGGVVPLGVSTLMVTAKADNLYGIAGTSLKRFDNNGLATATTATTGTFALISDSAIYTKNGTTVNCHGLDTKLKVSKVPTAKQLYLPAAMYNFSYWSDNTSAAGRIYVLDEALNILDSKAMTIVTSRMWTVSDYVFCFDHTTMKLHKLDMDMNILKSVTLAAIPSSIVVYNNNSYTFATNGTSLRIDENLITTATVNQGVSCAQPIIFGEHIYVSTGTALRQLDLNLNKVGEKEVGNISRISASTAALTYQLSTAPESLYFDKGTNYQLVGYKRI